MPYQKVIDLDGRLSSVAISGFGDVEQLKSKIEEFVTRVALPGFVASDGEVRVFMSMGSASLAGDANVIVPSLIVALIALNAMMGADYERRRGIGVHVAEALVYATLGAVLGYLLGQSITLHLTRQDLVGGRFMNYSSLSAISSTAIVMATVVASTVYASRRAAALSMPSR
jgi:hypothetical protein